MISITGLEALVVDKIRGLMEAAKDPIIIVDGGLSRNRLEKEGLALIETTGYPYFVTAMGKGSITEHLPTFGGVYGGATSFDEIKKAVESSDYVLWLGNYPRYKATSIREVIMSHFEVPHSNDNTRGEFTEEVKDGVIVDFQRFYIRIGGVRFDAKMKYVLEKLLKGLKTKALNYKTKQITWEPYHLDNPPRLPKLSQDYLWARLGRYWRDGDFVVAETATTSYGIPGSSLKRVKNVRMYNQTIFGSIGFASGAAVGSFVAGKELGDLLRHEVNATVFVLNNGGYTVERLIHGMTASYNAVPIWDYGALFQAFGPSYKTKYHLAKTPDELDAILNDAEFNEASCAQIVELILDPSDAPDSVKRAAAAVEAFNARK